MKLETPYALQDPNQFTRLGRQIRENAPEIMQAAQDPANLTLFGLGAAGLGLGALAAPTVAGRAYGGAHRALFAEPGSVRLGWRRTPRGLSLPVDLSLVDRLMHHQFVAPTGGAKSSFFEWIFHQDLSSGLPTTLCIENAGDFGQKAMTRALLLGRPVYLLDPTVPNALKWNPLAGEPEEVAQAAVDAFTASAASGKEEFFKGLNSELLHHTIIALKAWEKVRGVPVNMGHLRKALMQKEFFFKILDVSAPASKEGEGKKKSRRLKVNAGALPEDTRIWFESKYLGDWTERTREEFTTGLRIAIGRLVARSAIKRLMSPGPGEQILDLDEAIDSGGFVYLSVPQDLVGDVQTRTISTWLLMGVIQAIRRRGRGGRPISVFIDEASALLGHASSDAATVFQNFNTLARHYNTILHLSFQSYALLPMELKSSLMTNARNKLIGGGLAGQDARDAKDIMGYTEEEITDARTTYRGLFGIPTRSFGSRSLETANLTDAEIRQIPRGHWHLRRVKNGSDHPPILVKAGRAPKLPVVYRPERVSSYPEPDGEL